MDLNNIKNHGVFIAFNTQNVNDGEYFHFDYTEASHEAFEMINSRDIVILNSGFYLINLITVLDSVGQIALYINDNIVQHTITSTEDFYDEKDEQNMIIIHKKLNLKKNDIITIKNYNTFDTITTKQMLLNKNIEKFDILKFWNVKLSILEIY
jgi:hypothetical protein